MIIPRDTKYCTLYPDSYHVIQGYKDGGLLAKTSRMRCVSRNRRCGSARYVADVSISRGKYRLPPGPGVSPIRSWHTGFLVARDASVEVIRDYAARRCSLSSAMIDLFVPCHGVQGYKGREKRG